MITSALWKFNLERMNGLFGIFGPGGSYSWITLGCERLQPERNCEQSYEGWLTALRSENGLFLAKKLVGW